MKVVAPQQPSSFGIMPDIGFQPPASRAPVLGSFDLSPALCEERGRQAIQYFISSGFP